MDETVPKINNIETYKDKIRAKCSDEKSGRFITVPRFPHIRPRENTRVAVYIRHAHYTPEQCSSYELQEKYYTEFIRCQTNWSLVGFYHDENASGTSSTKLPAFKRMIKDCNTGKIDLILTKNLSCFSRNLTECIGYIRKLAEMNPAVGVLFKTEDIYTLNYNSEIFAGFVSVLEQEASDYFHGRTIDE